MIQRSKENCRRSLVLRSFVLNLFGKKLSCFECCRRPGFQPISDSQIYSRVQWSRHKQVNVKVKPVKYFRASTLRLPHNLHTRSIPGGGGFEVHTVVYFGYWRGAAQMGIVEIWLYCVKKLVKIWVCILPFCWYVPIQNWKSLGW